jgi:hypothetical protein
MMSTVILCLLLITILFEVESSCYRQCNKHGFCSSAGNCECFEGWYELYLKIYKTILLKQL